MARWFFWYVYRQGLYVPHGPELLSDLDAWHLEHSIRSTYLGAHPIRFAWQPGWSTWIPDARNDQQLLAGVDPTRVFV